MDKDTRITEEIRKTLEVYAADRMPEELPYLQAKILAERKFRKQRKHQGFRLQYALNSAFVILILILNITAAVFFFEHRNSGTNEQRLVAELKRDLQITDVPEAIDGE